MNAINFGPCYFLAVTLPCCMCGEPAPSAGHHVRSRGATGHDWANVVPLCRDRIDQGEEGCHSKGDRIGWVTFQREQGTDLAVVAHEVACEVFRRYERGEVELGAEGIPEGWSPDRAPDGGVL